MKPRVNFSDKSGLFQLWLLFLYIVIGLIIASILSLFLGVSGTPINNPGTLRLIQAVSVIFSFLFPAIALAWSCSDSPAEYLSANRLPSAKVFLLVFAGLLLFAPTINITALLNKQLVLPPFLESLEVWMLDKEEQMEALINLLINEEGITALISNIIVIALLAALTEEFLFRGAIQRIIEKWTNNHHIVIWSAAIVFSAIHMQFYGFIPRMLLGAYFGYLLYWSQSIWLPVFAHFVHNSIAVFVERGQNTNDNYNEYISGDIKNEHLTGYIILTIVTLVLFYFLNKKIRQEAKAAA